LIRVSQLVIYPIKSCRGVEVDLATVGTTGFELDRRWMVIGDDGRFLSQREHHRLALVRVQLDEDRLRLEAHGLPSLEVGLEGEAGPASRVQVWDDECAAVAEGEDAARWFSRHLGCSARLVRMASDDARPLGSSTAQPGDHVSFADGFPFLLLSTASLDGLNRRLSLPVPMDRFRPNIVIDGCEPHAEDGWHRIRPPVSGDASRCAPFRPTAPRTARSSSARIWCTRVAASYVLATGLKCWIRPGMDDQSATVGRMTGCKGGR